MNVRSFLLFFFVAFWHSFANAVVVDWWVESAPEALDVAVEKQQRWLIGKEGILYQWSEQTSQWRRFTSPSNLTRLSISEEYIAVVKDNGESYVSPIDSPDWKKLSDNIRDVSFSDSYLWVIDDALEVIKRVEVSLLFTDRSRTWEVFDGKAVNIAASDTTAWVTDATGGLFQLVNEEWIKDNNAPLSFDIALADDGTVFISSIAEVRNAEIDTRNMGFIYRRQSLTGQYQQIPGNAKYIAAQSSGNLWGVNRFGWLIRSVEQFTSPTNELNTAEQAEVTIADLYSADAPVPKSILSAPVFNVSSQGDIVFATTSLNGLATKLAIYRPQGSDSENLLVGHSEFTMADYVPDIEDLAINELGAFQNVVFAFLPAENIEKAPRPADRDALSTYFNNTRAGTYSPFSELEFFADYDLESIQEGAALRELLDSPPLMLSVETSLPSSIFNNVQYSEEKVSPLFLSSQRTLDNLKSVYGEELLEEFVLYASAPMLEGAVFGPARLSFNEFRFTFSDTFQIAIVSDIFFKLYDTDLELGLIEATITYQHDIRSFGISGRVDADEVSKAVTDENIALQEMTFDGQYVALPNKDNVSQFEMIGKGEFTSVDEVKRQVDVSIGLALNEDETEVIPSLHLQTELTLADIIGKDVPVAENIALTEIEITDEYLKGVLQVDGKRVIAIRYENEDLSSPLSALLHEDLFLKTYVPEVANEAYAGLGFDKAVMFIRDGEGDAETFESLEDLPELLQEFVIDDYGTFPLSIKNGISSVGYYLPNESESLSELSESERQLQQETEEVFSDLGIPQQGFMARGYYDAEMLIQVIRKIGDEQQGQDTSASSYLSEMPEFNFAVEMQLQDIVIPKTEALLSLNSSKLVIERQEEQLMSAIVSGMTLKLDMREQSSNFAMSMNGIVSFEIREDTINSSIVASTYFDTQNARIPSLQSLTDFPQAESSSQINSDTRYAWEDVLGIPEFGFVHTAFSTQLSIDRGVSVNLPDKLNTDFFAQGYLGKENIAVDGNIELKLSSDESKYEFEDARLNLPGPIRLSGLPGFEYLPKINEMTLSDVFVSPQEMYGRLSWGAENTGVAAYLSLHDSGDETQPALGFEVFARLDGFRPSMLNTGDSRIDGVIPAVGIPDSFWNQQSGPAVIALRNQPRRELLLTSDLPESFTTLFTGLGDSSIPAQTLSLADIGDELTLANGLTILTRFDANRIAENSIREILVGIGLNQPIFMSGAVEFDSNNQYQARFTATTDSIEPESGADVFGIQPSWNETSLLFSTFDGGEFGIESSGSVTLGSETVEVFGYRAFALNTQGKILSDDWRLYLPGPVSVGGLPGFTNIQAVNQWILSAVDLNNDGLHGRLSWPQQQTGGSLQIVFEENGPPSLYSRIDSIQSSSILTQIKDTPLDQHVSPAFLSIRAEEKKFEDNEQIPDTLSNMLFGLKDAPEEYQRISVVREEQPISLNAGITLFGLTDTGRLEQTPPLDSLFDLVNIIDGRLYLTGRFVQQTDQTVAGEIDVVLGQVQIDSIPESSIDFYDSMLRLSNVETNQIRIETLAKVKPPIPLDVELPMSGEMVLEFLPQAQRLSYALTVIEEESSDYRISSEGIWKNPPLIPDVEVTDLGFEGEVVSAPTGNTYQCALVGESEIDSVSAKISVELCNGYDMSTSLSRPDYDPILFIERELRLSSILAAATGLIDQGSDQTEQERRQQTLDDVLLKMGDVAMSKILISNKALAADFDINVANRFDLKGTGAFVFDDDQYAFFLRNDDVITIGEMLPERLAPLDLVRVPKGVFALSTQANDDFDVSELPVDIFENVFGGIIEQEKADNLKVQDGVTFFAKMGLSDFPNEIEQAASTFGLAGEFLLGGSVGGVFGGTPSIGLYISLGQVSVPLPDFAGEIIEVKDADVELLMVTEGPGAPTEVAFASDALLKVPRLDDPGQRDEIETKVSVGYAVGGADAGSTFVSADIQGQWQDPMGLEGFSLTNTKFAVGISTLGTTIGIESEQAEFKDKQFILDLDSAWAGALPTQLSIQFAKSPSMTEDLIIDPLLQLELVGSIFNLAFKSGSALADNIFTALESTQLQLTAPPGMSPQTVVNSLTAFASFSTKLQRAGNGMVDLMRDSPLSMVGIRNPQIFFVTPGNSLPPREGIDRPPLGLGLVAEGDLILNAGSLSADIANGEYKINLRDGYYVRGEIKPPPPMNDSNLSVTVQQSLLTFTPTALRLEGNIGFPGALVPGFSSVASGYFDFKREEIGSAVNVNAGVILANGNIEREASLRIYDNTIDIYSAPRGCVDVPIKIDGVIAIDNPSDVSKLLTIAQPSLPSVADVLTCPEDLLSLWRNALQNPASIQADAALAMTDLSKEALDLLPDNPATRQLYQGVEAVEEALGFTSDLTNDIAGEFNDVAGNIPGSEYVGEGVGEAIGLVNDVPGVDYGAQAAAAAAAQASKAISDIGNSVGELLGGDPAAFAEGLANAALGQLSDAASFVSGGFNTIKNAITSPTPYCNKLIRAMRAQGTAPETNARAIELWKPFEAVWKASLQANHLISVVGGVQNRVYQDNLRLWYLSEEWNRYATKLGREFEQPYVINYHKNNVPGITYQTTSRTFKTSDYYSELSNLNYVRFSQAKGVALNVEQTLARLKQWQEVSNFDPNADYVGFRCEKQSALVTSMQGAVSLNVQVTPTNAIATDYLTRAQYENAHAKVYEYASRMQDDNARIISDIATVQRVAIERNIEYIADFASKMRASINKLEALVENDPVSSQDTLIHIENAYSAVERFFDSALDVVTQGSDKTRNIDLDAEIESVITHITAAYRSRVEAQLAKLNAPWSSTTEMTLMIFPYADKCLRSFYRPLDNRNPLYVSDCMEALDEKLKEIKSGVSYDLVAGARLLEKIRYGVDGTQIVTQDLRYQFMLWNVGESNEYTRVATAQSMQSPLAAYCLGVQRAFAPPITDPVVEATPCLVDDPSQRWEKIADEGGASFFRLRSPGTELCATWNGLDGVDALVLKQCNEINKPNQVMTAGWPIRVAEQPLKMLTSKQRSYYAWTNFDSVRCMQRMGTNSNSFDIAAVDCGVIKADQKVPNNRAFVPIPVENDQWKFTYPIAGGQQCLVSSETKVTYSSVVSPSGKDRLVSVGNCNVPEAHWKIEPSDMEYEGSERKYKIIEAYGLQQCMAVTVPKYGDLVDMRESALRLQECSTEGDFDQLFIATPVQPSGSLSPQFSGIVAGNVDILLGDSPLTNAAKNVEITLSQGDRTQYIVSTNEYGAYQFSGVMPGNYLVEARVSVNKYSVLQPRSVNVSVQNGMEAIVPTLRLSGKMRITGHVREVNQGAKEGHEVTLVASNGARITALTNEIGMYKFYDYPPGNYRIEVSQEGYKALRKPNGIDVTLTNRNVHQLNFLIEPVVEEIEE